MDKVDGFRIPVDDFERAQRFYLECFGWKLDPPGYRLAGDTDARMIKRRALIRFPLMVIEVKEIEETMRKVSAAGGRIIIGKTKEDGGFSAYVQDSEGNTMGLWQVA